MAGSGSRPSMHMLGGSSEETSGPGTAGFSPNKPRDLAVGGGPAVGAKACAIRAYDSDRGCSGDGAGGRGGSMGKN